MVPGVWPVVMDGEFGRQWWRAGNSVSGRTPSCPEVFNFNHCFCRYASSAISTSIFGGQNMTRVVSGLDCNGEEESLIDCDHDNFGDLFCPGEGLNDLAGVVCTDTQVNLASRPTNNSLLQADLEPDLYLLMTSAYLEDKPLFLLQCAMEENCVAQQAYVERTTNPYWQTHTRRLLR